MNYQKHLDNLNTIITTNDQTAEHYVSSLENTRELIVALGVKLGYFTYWETITSNGSLMELSPDELRIINTSYRVIVQTRNIQDESFNKFSLDILYRLYQHSIPLQQKITILRTQVSLYLYTTLEACRIVKGQVDNVKNNISWIDLTAEPILEFKQEIPSVTKNGIFVREDGVTVYPDGMEVDRKGTIIKMGK